MENNLFLSVIIPCYNEENNIRDGCVAAVVDYLKNSNFSYEILVIDDASTDKSVELLREYEKREEIRLIQKEHSFKAGTVIRGIREATGEYILMTDMDQATPIKEFDKFLPYLKKDVDIIIGSRKDERRGAPLSRKVMAKGFIMLRNLILGLHKIKDTQCGFKVFKRNAAQNVVNKLKLYGDDKINSVVSKVTAGFDVEILYLAQKMKYSIIEIPVVWNYVETRRVNPISDSIDGLVDMLKIRLNDLMHKYD